MSERQTFANHRRFDPWYHMVATPLLLVAFIMAGRQCWQGGGLWPLLVSFALLVILLRFRIYSLRVQDRVIRLEETLRLTALLPDVLKPRIQELKPGQFVALRFAADSELAERFQEALNEGLGGEAIKKRIQQWRPDTFRV